MKTINLTSTSAALDYLRSLPADTPISLPGAYAPLPDPGPADAVAVVTGQPANAWAASMNRWEWTAAELIASLPITTKILFIERPVSDSNTYGVETGQVEGEDQDAEGYQQTFSSRFHPRSQEDTERLDAMREEADAIYEVDNICAKNNQARLK